MSLRDVANGNVEGLPIELFYDLQENLEKVIKVLPEGELKKKVELLSSQIRVIISAFIFQKELNNWPEITKEY